MILKRFWNEMGCFWAGNVNVLMRLGGWVDGCSGFFNLCFTCSRISSGLQMLTERQEQSPKMQQTKSETQEVTKR